MVRKTPGRVSIGRLMTLDLGDSTDASKVDFVITHCSPPRAPGEPAGAIGKDTEIHLDPRPLPSLARCHILPYEDAKPPNPNLIYDVYLKPFLFDRCGPLHEGFEFSYKDCRFRVAGTDPSSGEGDAFYVSRCTEMFWKGPPIQRAILRTAQVLPYFQTLPPGGMDVAARADIVQAHFKQRSAPVKVADEFTTETGVRFRVTKCEPSSGGIMPNTKLSCDGPALMACAICNGLAVRRCEAPGCGKLICTPHAKQVSQDGGTKTMCPEHGGG